MRGGLLRSVPTANPHTCLRVFPRCWYRRRWLRPFWMGAATLFRTCPSYTNPSRCPRRVTLRFSWRSRARPWGVTCWACSLALTPNSAARCSSSAAITTTWARMLMETSTTVPMTMLREWQLYWRLRATGKRQGSLPTARCSSLPGMARNRDYWDLYTTSSTRATH